MSLKSFEMLNFMGIRFAHLIHSAATFDYIHQLCFARESASFFPFSRHQTIGLINPILLPKTHNISEFISLFLFVKSVRSDYWSTAQCILNTTYTRCSSPSAPKVGKIFAEPVAANVATGVDKVSPIQNTRN